MAAGGRCSFEVNCCHDEQLMCWLLDEAAYAGRCCMRSITGRTAMVLSRPAHGIAHKNTAYSSSYCALPLMLLRPFCNRCFSPAACCRACLASSSSSRARGPSRPPGAAAGGTLQSIITDNMF
jgi:hypothetical protein